MNAWRSEQSTIEFYSAFRLFRSLNDSFLLRFSVYHRRSRKITLWLVINYSIVDDASRCCLSLSRRSLFSNLLTDSTAHKITLVSFTKFVYHARQPLVVPVKANSSYTCSDYDFVSICSKPRLFSIFLRAFTDEGMQLHLPCFPSARDCQFKVSLAADYINLTSPLCWLPLRLPFTPDRLCNAVSPHSLNILTTNFSESEALCFCFLRWPFRYVSIDSSLRRKLCNGLTRENDPCANDP